MASRSSALLVCVLVLIGGSLGWLAWELNRPIVFPPSASATTGTKAMPAFRHQETRPLPASLLAAPKKTAGSPEVEALNVPGSIPGEALLTFRTPEALAAFRDRAAKLGLRVLGYDPQLRTARVRFGDPSGLARDLDEYAGDYSHVGPNYVARIPGLPTEPVAETDTANAGGREPFRSQGLDSIGATGDRSKWGQGVKVAVIDSGVGAHPSLDETRITHIDLLKDGSEMNGHGTAMASLIAGNDPNVGGVAPSAELLDIRVTDSQGESNTALLASGIVKAADLGARVINISLGSAGYSPVLAEAVQYAQSRNAIVVAAAGNEQQTALLQPAGLPGVLSVGAVDANGNQAWFSNSGGTLTLAAPGVGIVSGYSKGQLVIGSGTSQAAAITSGVVAQLMARGYSAPKIIPLLSRTAKPLNAPSTAVGAGLIQIPR